MPRSQDDVLPEASRRHGSGKKAAWEWGFPGLVPGWAPLRLAGENTGLVSPELLFKETLRLFFYLKSSKNFKYGRLIQSKQQK